MKEERFQGLIKKDKYQVFLFACPASFPICFAKHPWFVLNKKGVISRWEVVHLKNKTDESLGYLYLNNRAPFLGISVIYLCRKYFWKAKLLKHIESDENGLAKKMIDFIEKSKGEYPYCDRYSFFGPNSNTYVQWVLDKFPEFKVNLSWRFIGKGFKVK